MKKKTFQIDIPEPCNESWDKMTPKEKGRFCSSCEKTVIDFSYQPDRMIAKTLKEGNGQICGRFRTDQLQRDFVLEPAFYQNTRWKAFGLMLSGFLATETLKGQDVIMPSISTEIRTSSTVNKKNNSTFESKIVLSGRILAEDNQEVLIAAAIILKGSDIGCSTDTNGVFRLEISTEKSHLIKNKLVLEISYLGYTTKEIIIKKEELQNNLVINLSDIHLLGSGIDMPVLECVTERSPFISQDQTTVGKLITDEIVNINSKEDQTLYQWLRKRIIKKRAQKAERQEEENKKEEVLETTTRKAETPILNTNEIISEPKIIQKIYPNPFKDELTIEIKVEQSETYDLVLFNELGQEIHRKTVAAISGINQFTLHLNENKLAIGTYLLSILNGKDVIQTEIVIKK